MPVVKTKACWLSVPMLLAAPQLLAKDLPHSTLPSGWVEYQPGGDTSCARGQPYSFFVYPGDPRRLIVDFMGGGSCATAETCAQNSFRFIDSVDGIRLGLAFGLPGTNDFNNAENPYNGWTHVMVPYCTGDVHWGHADTTYTNSDGSRFTIYHRGSVNVKAALDWAKEQLADADRVFVSGCSAGAYASIFYTPQIQEDFPKAQVNQFGDAGAAIPAPGKPGLNRYPWRIEDAAPRWIADLDPAKVDYSQLNVSDLYIREARHYPKIHFAQYNSAQDILQKEFYPTSDKSTWSPRLFASMAEISKAVPNFDYFIAPGAAHCGTFDDTFYSLVSEGVRLRDWLANQVAYGPYSRVSCIGEHCDD